MAVSGVSSLHNIVNSIQITTGYALRESPLRKGYQQKIQNKLTKELTEAETDTELSNIDKLVEFKFIATKYNKLIAKESENKQNFGKRPMAALEGILTMGAGILGSALGASPPPPNGLNLGQQREAMQQLHEAVGFKSLLPPSDNFGQNVNPQNGFTQWVKDMIGDPKKTFNNGYKKFTQAFSPNVISDEKKQEIQDNTENLNSLIENIDQMIQDAHADEQQKQFEVQQKQAILSALSPQLKTELQGNNFETLLDKVINQQEQPEAEGTSQSTSSQQQLRNIYKSFQSQFDEPDQAAAAFRMLMSEIVNNDLPFEEATRDIPAEYITEEFKQSVIANKDKSASIDDLEDKIHDQNLGQYFVDANGKYYAPAESEFSEAAAGIAAEEEGADFYNNIDNNSSENVLRARRYLNKMMNGLELGIDTKQNILRMVEKDNDDTINANMRNALIIIENINVIQEKKSTSILLKAAQLEGMPHEDKALFTRIAAKRVIARMQNHPPAPAPPAPEDEDA